tara:strand:- start:442 stop:1269 length:828 start_codon:yes stop_codon:yes gene_type:complete
MKYRMQRWWLTPSIRVLLRFGLPLVLIVTGSLAFLADEGRRAAVEQAAGDLRAALAERPEFRVDLMAIDGASADLDRVIRNTLDLALPVSSFDLDLEDIRATVDALPAVETVGVRVRPGGVLQIDVSERIGVVLWRSADGLKLLDDTGMALARVDYRVAHPDLPLMAGQGADLAVGEALALLAAAQPLEKRLRGLVRVGGRRWDVVLDRGQRIQLPETGYVGALERVLALDAARELLDRDVTVVDMRLADRPTLRLAEAAVDELQRIRTLNGTKR